MNTGLTVDTFFVRRLIVQRGEIRHRYQGGPDSDPERLLLLFRELFNTEKKKVDYSLFFHCSLIYFDLSYIFL